jgi:Rrf2 family iron-sulfur cluster assembly transcriptional regulator
MKIPTKGRYAVSALMDLALNEKTGPLTIADIAEKQNISLSYLEQLFAELRKQGLVRGTRGPGGGYRLARAANEITIAQIISAVDDKAVQTSKENEQYMPNVLWARLSRQIYNYLNGITLAECIENPSARELVAGSGESTQARSEGSKVAA